MMTMNTEGNRILQFFPTFLPDFLKSKIAPDVASLSNHTRSAIFFHNNNPLFRLHTHKLKWNKLQTIIINFNATVVLN